MDIDELIELVELHGKSIYGFCYKLTGNKEDTDDLYQEPSNCEQFFSVLISDRSPSSPFRVKAGRPSANVQFISPIHAEKGWFDVKMQFIFVQFRSFGR